MSFYKKKISETDKETVSVTFSTINQLFIEGYICAAVLIQGILIRFIHLLLK